MIHTAVIERGKPEKGHQGLRILYKASDFSGPTLRLQKHFMSSENDYVSRQGDKSEIPVQADEATVEDPIDENTANTDAQLERDDNDAIDKSNIINQRTRHAGPKEGYREPGDEEGIPVDQ
ncbi:hypothetical protein XA68_16654 [Ophiocordyceps unilateralis]|uniref:Uncharacterized protein n=1 Tax=Ophiocordyceps unilateralis TaxID=268505 RepID=A0A2A9PNY2_OPHUN|nr:hypothetical protein XA68_16654 [Ophiocordyceps unilateralis]